MAALRVPVAGLLLLLLANGRWIVPAATWLYPVLVIRFLRTEKRRRYVAAYCMAIVLTYCVAWRGLIQLSGPTYYAVASGIGLAFVIPFLLDRAFAPRLQGVTSTLVFPLAYTVVEFIGFRLSPYGTWGSLAYTQFGNLPLMQLASVTGIYGLTFLITWFASVVNLAWDHNFDWPQVRRPTGVFTAVLASVLLLGGMSLVLLRPASREVKVAGVQSHVAEAILQPVVERLSAGDFSEPVWRQYFEQTDVIIDDLFEKSALVANGGAKMISWAENPVMVRETYETTLLERGMQFAKQQQVYLLMNYSINLSLDPRRAPAEKLWSARVVVVGPSGDVLSRYRKTILVPGMEARLAVSGDDDAVVIMTPHGRVSSLICYDNDFPAFVRNQVGKEGADILFDPSGDWRNIDPYHTQMTAFRAIENGFSVVRVTALGLSAAYDYQGRTLATMDYFRTEDKVFTAFVPERGIWTIYAQVGDVFGWAALLALAAVCGPMVLRKR